jgi:hypothetical protein
MTFRFRQWLAWMLRRERRSLTLFRWIKTERLPQTLVPHTVYEVGDAECSWSAALLCPCGCGSMIQLSLVTDASPSWILHRHRNRSVTLIPSVRRTTGCRGHFVVRRGRILWCGSEFDEEW